MWGVLASGPEGAGEAGTVQRKQQDAMRLERRGGEGGGCVTGQGCHPALGLG